MANYKKIKKFINYIIGPLLFVAIAWFIYRKIAAIPDLDHHAAMLRASVEGSGKWMLVVAFLFVFFNWGIEALKWKQLVSHLMKFPFSDAIQSVLAGVSFTMLTPNRMGEFLGRALYMPDGSRIKTAALTSIGSLSQIIITLAGGITGLTLLILSGVDLHHWPELLLNSLKYGTWTALMAALLVYFNLGLVVRLAENWPPLARYSIFIHAIGEIHLKELLKILGLSFIRYVVFFLQYWYVSEAFGLGLSLHTVFICTSIMFLILTLIPSISLAELGIRNQVSLYVFGLFTENALGIVVLTTTIMVINIILPAIVGSLILLSVRLFGKQIETHG